MSTAIMCILFLTMLVMVVFSATYYKSSVSSQADNNDTRAVLSYVVTAVKANKTDDISLEDHDGMQMLVIYDDQTELEQRIYYKDGRLMENYGLRGAAFRDDSAAVIAEPGFFEMNMIGDQLLEIKTDAGNSYVNIGN